MKISLKQINEGLGVNLSKEEVEKAFSEHAFEIDEILDVGGDVVFELDVLPNRSSDSLSVLGLLRELAAILNIDFKDDPFLSETPDFSKYENELLQTSIEKESSAKVYIAALIRGAKVQESPGWLKEFLAKQGQKPINNLVDATNYVLFYYGQPTHVFDADKLNFENSFHLGVRPAREGEKINTLDEQEFELKPSVSVISDYASKDQSALAIAGIKGGLQSAVSDSTVNIILESAKFDPTLTRKASQALALRTDASKRFENEVPDLLPFYGMQVLIDKILEIAGGELKAVSVSLNGDLQKETEFAFDYKKINRVLNENLEPEKMQEILTLLKIKIEGEKAIAPWWRLDISSNEDLAEEIMRLYTLKHLAPEPLPQSNTKRTLLKSYFWAEALRKFLTEKGWVEVTNSSLQDKGELELANALASDKNFYRDDLAYQLKKALDKNEPNSPLLGIYEAIKIFEIGNVYKSGKEFASVALGARPVRKKKRESATAEILQNIKSEIEKEFSVSLPKPEGEILEFDLSLLFKDEQKEGYPKLESLPNIQYKPFSQYPFVLRDIAVWLPDSADKLELENLIKKESGELLKRMDIFDEFAKDGRVSYAYHLVFQADDRTLTDEEVNQIMEKIEQDARERDWEPR